ncbi:tetratricopeptide repeat protein [Candidatus Fermentibacteria bacterium]|nr:tetratricopeptide repeat protein [Candidatus Fermentibacteria bacterium]
MHSSLADLLDRDLLKLAESARDASFRAEKMSPGERRDVAILFLDIEGFTALSENLNHETLHRLTTGLMGALSRIIEGLGGYIDKFEGDRVMALFGAREATEDDCTRAVTCGLRMLQLMRDLAPVLEQSGLSIGARVGLSYGSVTVALDAAGHMTATGDEVNVASRLEGMADSNSLFASGKVHDMCADTFEWTDLGQMQIRGRTKTVRVWRADGFGGRLLERWEKASALRPAPLVGRDAGLAALEACWMEQGSGSGLSLRGAPRHVVAVVQGVAGIGKSRLIHEFLEAHRDEIVLMSSRTASFDQPPWWLWTGLLRKLAGKDRPSPDDLLSAVKTAAGGCVAVDDALSGSERALRALSIPGAPGKPEADTPESWSDGIKVAIRDLVRTLASSSRRAVLLLEDMQWADGASMDALDFVLRNTEIARPLLVLISQRSDTEECAFRPGSMSSGYINLHTIHLHPLDTGSARLIIRFKLGYRPDEEVPGGIENWILERCEGNPYYIEEILSELVGKGILVPDGERFTHVPGIHGGFVPSSIAGLIRSRIDRLPSDLRCALQIASVLGGEFDEAVFSELCGQEGMEPAVVLEGLSSLRFIGSRGGSGQRVVFFRSPLAREVMYEHLLRHNRTVLHRRAARATEEAAGTASGALAGAVAWHWWKGGEPVQAIRRGTEAAASLSENFQLDSAEEWVERLLDWMVEVEEGPLRDELMLRLLLVRIGIMESRPGPDMEEVCRKALSLAGSLGLPLEEAIARKSLGSEIISRGRPEEGRPLLEESLAWFEANDQFTSMLYTRFVLADMLRTQGKLDEALSVIETGLGEARRRNAAKQITSCLSSMGAILVSRGRFDDALAAFSEALDIERKKGRTRGLSVLLTNVGVLHGMREEIDEALACFEESMRIQAELGVRRGEGVALNNMGNCYVALERIDEARACFRKRSSSTGKQAWSGDRPFPS